jgi:hypothetical protein
MKWWKVWKIVVSCNAARKHNQMHDSAQTSKVGDANF